MTWSACKLGDLLCVEHGFAFKGEHFNDEGELVVLTPGNFHEEGGFRPRPGKDRFYAAAFPDRYLLSAGDLIVAMTEQGEGLLGSSAVVPESNRYLHNQRIGLVKERRDRACRRFLYYLFNTPLVREQIRNTSSGAKVRHTSPERIYGVTVHVPEPEMQMKMAAILSAYDDLIANNQRRIALLEGLAEEIYREWFVRMRFPGHATTPIHNRVPAGWITKKLPEVASITYGFPFAGDRFNDQGVGKPIIRIRDVPRGSSVDFTDEIGPDKCIVRPGDFLIGMDGEFHMNHWVGEDAWLVQRVCRITPNEDKLRAYLSLALRAPVKHFEQTIVGATVGHLGAKHLNAIDVLLPPSSADDVLDALNNILEQKLALAKRSLLLAKMRDALLPRLISGKLKVDHLDIRLPPSMRAEAEAVA